MLCALALLFSISINAYLLLRMNDVAEQARDERHLSWSRMIEFQFRLDAFARKAELITKFEARLQKLVLDIETLYNNQIFFEKTLTEVVKGIVSDGSKNRSN